MFPHRALGEHLLGVEDESAAARAGVLVVGRAADRRHVHRQVRLRRLVVPGTESCSAFDTISSLEIAPHMP